MRRNIVYYVTRQYMKRNKKRTAVTFLGIMLMVLLMTCIFVGKDTGIGYLEQASSLKDGKWHVSMYGIGEKEYEEVLSLPYVKETAVSAYLGNTMFDQSGNKERPYLNVKSYTGKCFDWMNISLVVGRLPEREGELLISRSALDDGGDISAGDRIDAEFFRRSITGIDEEAKEIVFPFSGITLTCGETIEVPEDFPFYEENTSFRENKEYTGETERYQITGIMETPSYEQGSAAGYTALTFLSEERAGTMESFNLSIILDLEKLPEDYTVILREITGTHEIDFNNYLLVFSANSSEGTINIIVRFMTVLFTALIMICSILLIYNVFHMSFQERSRYLGMLCSVGATGRQKRSSIYFEAVYLLIFALPAGILSGIGIILLAMKGLRPLLGGIMGLEEIVEKCPVSISVSVENILLVIVISTMTVLLAAWLPARKIGRIGPIECIRGNTERRKRGYAMNLSALRRWGAEGMLAKNTLARQRRKTRAMITAASVFMVILVVTAFGSGAIHQIMHEKIDDRGMFSVSGEQYDYTLFGNGLTQSYQAVVQEIRQDPGVEKTVLWGDGTYAGEVPEEVYGREYWEAMKDIYQLNYRKELSDEEFKELYPWGTHVVNLLEVDSDTMEKFAEAAGAGAEELRDASRPSAIVIKDGAVSTDRYTIWGMEPERYRYYHIENLTDYRVGDSIPVSFYNEGKEQKIEYPIAIAGFVKPEQLGEDSSFGMSGELWLIIGEETAEGIRAAADSREDDSVIKPFLRFKMNGKETDIIDRLTRLCDNEDADMMLGKMAYIETLASSLVRLADILLGCFVVLSSLICLLNLFNSVKGWITGRRQELAILQSAGMTGGQMRKMLLFECAGIFVKAVFFAGILCGLMIYGLQKSVDMIFGNIRLPLPIAGGAAAVLLSAAVLAGFALYSLKRERRENLFESIRGENI